MKSLLLFLCDAQGTPQALSREQKELPEIHWCQNYRIFKGFLNLPKNMNFWICWQFFFGFVDDFFLDLSTNFVLYLLTKFFWICWRNFLDLSTKCFGFVDVLFWICVSHTAWAPKGHEGRSQAGPKGQQLEVGAQRVPKLLVFYIIYFIFNFSFKEGEIFHMTHDEWDS